MGRRREEGEGEGGEESVFNRNMVEAVSFVLAKPVRRVFRTRSLPLSPVSQNPEADTSNDVTAELLPG